MTHEVHQTNRQDKCPLCGQDRYVERGQQWCHPTCQRWGLEDGAIPPVLPPSAPRGRIKPTVQPDLPRGFVLASVILSDEEYETLDRDRHLMPRSTMSEAIRHKMGISHEPYGYREHLAEIALQRPCPRCGAGVEQGCRNLRKNESHKTNKWPHEERYA